MREYTDITVLLDRSGSMASIKKAMEEAYNGFIAKHKENKSTRITLVQFDDINDQQVVYQDVPVTEAKPLKLVPRGGTPLMDALCKALDNTGERLSDMDEADRPDQVLFVIITDGEENSSLKFKREDVKKRIQTQNKNYSWQFVYLGANQDAFQEAEALGIARARAVSYTASLAGTAGAWRGLTANTVNYTKSSGGLRGQSVASSLDFSDEQREDAIDNSSDSSAK